MACLTMSVHISGFSDSLASSPGAVSCGQNVGSRSRIDHSTSHVRTGQRVGIAVSGGADSVFLLHALRELGLPLSVIHIEHGIRGAASIADAEFVGQLAPPSDCRSTFAKPMFRPSTATWKKRRETSAKLSTPS